MARIWPVITVPAAIRFELHLVSELFPFPGGQT